MIELVGFDGDDTLWHSEGYYQHAAAEFERIVGHWIDVADAGVRTRLHAAERRNLTLFGYGAKSMALSMVEAAIEATDGRICATDIHRIVALGKALLAHLARLCIERDCARLEWSVLDWNTPSIGFYRSLGAKPMDEWTVMRVDGEALDALAGAG